MFLFLDFVFSVTKHFELSLYVLSYDENGFSLFNKS